MKTRGRIFATLALAVMLIARPDPARPDFNAGLQAYERGDYKGALEQWRPAAEKGDPYAQHMLGFLYANGRAVALDPEQAKKWWRRAAEQGLAPAQYTLGMLFRRGLGVRRDLEKAALWIGRAADAGYPDAQYEYGVMHATGEGVKADLSAAFMWLDLAAAAKGLEKGAFRKFIDPLLTPLQRLEADQLKKGWKE